MCWGYLKVSSHCLFNWTTSNRVGGEPSPIEVIPSGPRAGLGLADEIISVWGWQRSQHSVILGQSKSLGAEDIVSTIKSYLYSTWAQRWCWGLAHRLWHLIWGVCALDRRKLDIDDHRKEAMLWVILNECKVFYRIFLLGYVCLGW